MKHLQHFASNVVGCGGCGRSRKREVPKTLSRFYSEFSPIPQNARLSYLYERAIQHPSDLNHLLPKLREMALQCPVVVEFGSRSNITTVALLAGQPEHLVSYDRVNSPLWENLKLHQGKTVFEFAKVDVLKVEAQACDLLLLNHIHTDEQIKTILDRHAPKVRRWVAFLGTSVYGEQGEDGGPGMLAALQCWMTEHPKWSIVYQSRIGKGLTVLGYLNGDKHPLPLISTMAWNYAKAYAKHKLLGSKMASKEQVEKRLSRCSVCSQRRENRCSICGCFLDVAPGERDGKALWEDSVCPLELWDD